MSKGRKKEEKDLQGCLAAGQELLIVFANWSGRILERMLEKRQKTLSLAESNCEKDSADEALRLNLGLGIGLPAGYCCGVLQERNSV